MQQLGNTGREVFAIFDQDDTKNVMKIALKKHFKLEKTAAETEQAAEADELQDSQVPEWVSTDVQVLWQRLCQRSFAVMQ